MSMKTDVLWLVFYIIIIGCALTLDAYWHVGVSAVIIGQGCENVVRNW